MKPYISAWEVAYWQKTHKSKPINIDAITDFYKAGLQREIERITDSSVNMLPILDDINEWRRELADWLYCWFEWIHS